MRVPTAVLVRIAVALAAGLGLLLLSVAALRAQTVVEVAGGGAGVTFGFGSAPHTTRLDIGVRYLYGGEADYLTEDGIFWASEPVVYVPHRSRTDMVMIYIGVAFGR